MKAHLSWNYCVLGKIKYTCHQLNPHIISGRYFPKLITSTKNGTKILPLNIEFQSQCKVCHEKSTASGERKPSTCTNSCK